MFNKERTVSEKRTQKIRKDIDTVITPEET